MKVNSFTRTELDGSFVYFIFSKELLYIGETQKITFARWVQHFQRQGTFTTKVHRHIPTGCDEYLKNINLISVEIDEIRDDYPEARWRTITQAVEHSLHELLYKSPTGLIKNYYNKYQPDVDSFKIISDTSRTAPRSIPNDEWEYARKKANSVLQEMYIYI
jgi:hypothetical protein